MSARERDRASGARGRACAEVGEPAGSPAASDRVLDLRGIACPLNWAHARVALDEMRRGERLVLLLDDARAVRDIPAAAEAAGHAAVETVALGGGGGWQMVIEV